MAHAGWPCKGLDPGAVKNKYSTLLAHRLRRRAWRLGFRVQGSGFRVQGSGFRVQGSGFRVQVTRDDELDVPGSGFRV